MTAQPTTDFASLPAVIDYARRECAGAPATIELMVDGFYAVVHQENGWPRELVAPEAKPLSTGPGDGGEDRSHFSRLCDWVTGRRLG